MQLHTVFNRHSGKFTLRTQFGSRNIVSEDKVDQNFRLSLGVYVRELFLVRQKEVDA